jgi:hypothetical protein
VQCGRNGRWRAETLPSDQRAPGRDRGYCSRIAEILSSDERLREGNAALARGPWAEARALFERELETRETVDALEGLSWAAWWVEDVPVCLEARERAYRLSRRDGDMRRAAMLALWVADDYSIGRCGTSSASVRDDRSAPTLAAMLGQRAGRESFARDALTSPQSASAQRRALAPWRD